MILVTKPLHTQSFQNRLLFIVAALMLNLTISLFSSPVYAAIDVYEFETEQQETQYRGLIDELRCPKCQNQNLAGSDSQISKDLKRKTYQMVMEGKSDTEIKNYMYERYGDFISYKPPVRPATWVLWFFPPVFLVVLLVWWLWRNSNQNKARKLPDIGVTTVDTEVEGTASKASSTKSSLSSEEAASLDILLGKHGKKQSNDISDS